MFMVHDTEIPKPVTEVQMPEQESVGLYKDFLYREATSLLSRYLPEALPQEPTEILFSMLPAYLAKFRGRHYIRLNDYKVMNGIKRTIEEIRHVSDENWVKPPEEVGDWDKPERLSARGVNQYSIDSWKNIYTLVHELIHQKQAELYPSVSAELSASEVGDDDVLDKSKLHDALIQASRTHYYTLNPNNLAFPVTEGMAILGSYYVMSRFMDDLMKTGKTATAEKIRKIRNEDIHLNYRAERTPITDYPPEEARRYTEGLKIMRKLSKRFGEANTPKMLAAVNLKACEGIVRGTPEYQRIIEDPTLLPGLPQTA